MRKTTKILRLKKSLLKRYRFVFFCKNNKKNIINYGSFLKKFDFYFNFFFFFKPTFPFFCNFINLYYLSFKKKANYLYNLFFFKNFFVDTLIKDDYYNCFNSGFALKLTQHKDLNFFEVGESKENIIKFKKKFLLQKFFMFGNNYFNKNFLNFIDFQFMYEHIKNFLKFLKLFFKILVLSQLLVL